MGKDALIAEILALPDTDQRETLILLRDRLGDGPALSEEQNAELDRRLDRLDREGSKGEPWDKVYKDLSRAASDAHHHH